MLKLSKRAAVACATAALALGIGLSLLPDHIGEALLGAVWPGTRDVLVPLALAFAFAGIVFGATAGLRSLADTKRSLRARVLVAPLTVSGAAVGAVFGAREAAFGLAAAGLVAAAIWWRSLTTSVAASQDAPRHGRRSASRPRYGPPPARNQRVAATD